MSEHEPMPAVVPTPAIADAAPQNVYRLNWHRRVGGRLGIAMGLSVLSVASPFEMNSEAPVYVADEGMNANNQEQDYHIAGEGSCSPYDHMDARAAAQGRKEITVDFEEAQASFLKQNKSFAKNFALTSEPRIGHIYDILGVERPSKNPAKAAESITAVVEDDFFVAAKLDQPLAVVNTFCDETGKNHFYRLTTLEAGTYVFGAIVDKHFVKDGRHVTRFKNGREVVLPANALVAPVRQEHGELVQMVVTNKGGISTDKDFAPEVTCDNPLEKPQVKPPTVLKRKGKQTFDEMQNQSDVKQDPQKNDPNLTKPTDGVTGPPPPADRPEGDENGGTGDGGVPPEGEVDDDHSGDVTETPPPCPFGEGNC